MISLVDRRPAWRRGPTATPPIGAQTPGRNHRPRKKPQRSDPTSSPPSLSDGRLPQKAFQSQSFSRAKTPYPGYNNVSLLIDGGTAPVNFLKLQKALQVALAYTKLIPGRYDRFSERVLGPNATAAPQAGLKALFDRRLTGLEGIGAKTAETMKNRPPDKEEGFARLDALTR